MKLQTDQLRSFIDSLDISETLVYAVFSQPREIPVPDGTGKTEESADSQTYGQTGSFPDEALFTRQGERCGRLKLRPVALKGGLQLQAEFQFGPKTFHQQYPLSADSPPLAAGLRAFAEGTIFTSRADYQFHWTGADLCQIVRKPPTKRRDSLSHNRRKVYALREGDAVPFLVELGVMDRDGQVYPKKYDKFRQINKYLEFVEDALQQFPKEKPLYIVDFGSGKAYLTFALYHYLLDRGYTSAFVTGLDLKTDVVDFCNRTAMRLGYNRLHFEQGDIANFQIDEGPTEIRRLPDMIISLHACDIATDAALVKGLQWGCPVILAVPCCQHEFFQQLSFPAMEPIIRFGVTRDKQATLVTDASRALMLRAFGYSVEMVEFITMEHTPKNVLIRAYRDKNTGQRTSITIDESGYRAYRDFLDTWGVGRTFLELELSRLGVCRTCPI